MCAAAAYDLAWELFLNGDQLTYQQFIAVAGRSGELNQVDRLLDQGSKFGDIPRRDLGIKQDRGQCFRRVFAHAAAD